MICLNLSGPYRQDLAVDPREALVLKDAVLELGFDSLEGLKNGEEMHVGL